MHFILYNKKFKTNGNATICSIGWDVLKIKNSYCKDYKNESTNMIGYGT